MGVPDQLRRVYHVDGVCQAAWVYLVCQADWVPQMVGVQTRLTGQIEYYPRVIGASGGGAAHAFDCMRHGHGHDEGLQVFADTWVWARAGARP